MQILVNFMKNQKQMSDHFRPYVYRQPTMLITHNEM
jgi:hypothetical protein